MAEKFVEAVRNYPCLWDLSSKCFKDTKMKENAWKAIAEQVNISVRTGGGGGGGGGGVAEGALAPPNLEQYER